MKALILVDIQNDFLPGGALAVPHGDEVIPVANALIPHFNVVIATQDWHPADHKSFASRHPGREVGEVIDLHGLPQVLWPDHSVQGRSGAELAAGLHPAAKRRVFKKGIDPDIDSYSAFFDNGRRRATGLGDFLRMQDVTDIYLLGLATDYCVKATALDGFAEGFNVFVVEDGCRGVELRPGDTAAAIEEMKRAGVRIIRSSDILDGFTEGM